MFSGLTDAVSYGAFAPMIASVSYAYQTVVSYIPFIGSSQPVPEPIKESVVEKTIDITEEQSANFIESSDESISQSTDHLFTSIVEVDTTTEDKVENQPLTVESNEQNSDDNISVEIIKKPVNSLITIVPNTYPMIEYDHKTEVALPCLEQQAYLNFLHAVSGKQYYSFQYTPLVTQPDFLYDNLPFEYFEQLPLLHNYNYDYESASKMIEDHSEIEEDGPSKQEMF